MEDEGKQENGIIKNEIQRKLRILCLHGFRTSGEILKKLISRWPESVLEKLDLMFLDAPFPAQGKSDVEGIYDPPFFEWFQADKVTLIVIFFSLFYYDYCNAFKWASPILSSKLSHYRPKQASVASRGLCKPFIGLRGSQLALGSRRS